MSDPATTAPPSDMQLVVITPEMAADWLTANTSNRSVRSYLVERLAGAIRRGEWVVNGDPIRFDDEGALIDGQHRLWAILEAEMPVESYVISGLPHVAQDTVDQGAKRTLSDVLALRDERYAATLAASLNLLYRVQTNTIRMAGRVQPTVAQAVSMLDSNPELRDSVAAAHKMHDAGLGISTSVLAVSHFLFHQINPEDTEDFFAKLSSGAGLDEGHPILVFRQWMERVVSLRPRHPVNTYHAMLIKTWNAYRKGLSVTNRAIIFRAGGARPESWPTPI